MALLITIFAVFTASISSDYPEDAITPIHTSMLEAADLGNSVILDDGAKLTKVSRSDFISQIAAAQNISAQETEKILTASQTEEMKNNTTMQRAALKANAGGYYYFSYSKEFHLQNKASNPYKAQLCAQLYMWSDGQYAQIEKVRTVYTAAITGLSPYTWTSLAATYNIPGGGSFPTGIIDLLGDGQFSVTTTWSAGESAKLGDLGFSYSGGGSNIWTSDILHMRGTYQCYR